MHESVVPRNIPFDTKIAKWELMHPSVCGAREKIARALFSDMNKGDERRKTSEYPAPTSKARNARVLSSFSNVANVANDAGNLQRGKRSFYIH